MEFFLLVFHNSPAAWLFPLLDKKIIFPISSINLNLFFYMKSFSDEKWRCEDEKAAGFWRNDHFSLKCVSCWSSFFSYWLWLGNWVLGTLIFFFKFSKNLDFLNFFNFWIFDFLNFPKFHKNLKKQPTPNQKSTEIPKHIKTNFHPKMLQIAKQSRIFQVISNNNLPSIVSIFIFHTRLL